MKKWEPGVCNEISGFLFNHPCSGFADANCERCQKPVCTEHLREIDGRPVCIECAKSAGRKGIGRRGTSHHDAYYDDPYFYEGYHYDGWDDQHGHGGSQGETAAAAFWAATAYNQASRDDANEFTEADSESLVDEDGQDFETDAS